MAQSPVQLEDVGRTIAGRYHVDAVLGRGGMGAVYRVRDMRSGDTLALKRGFARTASKSQKRQALLEREYHTLVQLAHPRIIEVYDYGVDDLGPYYTMELLDGQDLDRGGRWGWEQACALLSDVASSLAILHSRGLLHRDVSSRNVRCTADGRAKLIDFGAMVSIGVAKDAVGTPPFMAPEVMQLQALDARADLFSLGALGYYLLTGRHAYHARRMSELRDVWRSRPQPPVRFVPDVPAALSALIMQLLSLDRGARPQSAAEVMERLCSVAALPKQEENALVSRAYLTTPTLVGRERAMVAVRRRMLSLARGDGGTLMLEGVAGSGRSRLLDACVLEAKLLGSVVVRADAGDGESGDWGVARALGMQLAQLLPQQAADAARLSRHVLGHVLDLPSDPRSPISPQASVSQQMPDRSLLIRELRDFILALARTQRLLLAVDDADEIDEPSLALIASLAHKTARHPLIVALTVECKSQHSRSSGLRLLRSIADRIELDLLQPNDTEALVRSVFGDARNISRIAASIHAHAQGSPRATMELAQHLVSRDLARYAAGSWLLPSTLDEADVPVTLSASLCSRLSELSADAHELCDVLCLGDGDALTLVTFPPLTEHCDAWRVFAALDELVTARVLVADGDRYRFSQRGFLAVLQQSMRPERREAIHQRLADLLSRTGGDVVRRAHHLLNGGRDLEAIDLLGSIDLLARAVPLPLLEDAALRAEQHGLPALTVHRLRMALLTRAPFVSALDLFRRYVPRVLQRLEQDSGLTLYRELGHLPPAERLSQALEQTLRRYVETPENERVHPPIDAIRELARLSSSCSSVAVLSFDLEFLESLPALEPLLPLSPALRVVSQLIAGAHLWVRGVSTPAIAVHEQILTRIGEPDRGGLEDVQHSRTRLGIHYMLGLLEASMGMASAERRAQVLETDRETRVNAWRVRQLLHLNQGNVKEAQTCLRRAELLQLQENLAERYLGSSAGFELRGHYRNGDLLGVKASVDTLTVLAEQHAGWKPVLLYGECRYAQMKGDAQSALELLLPGLAQVQPGTHVFFVTLAGLHLELLCDLGRFEQAVEHGLAYLEICEREKLLLADHGIKVATATALARSGEYAHALMLLQTVIATAERLGQGGLALGSIYETRARVAIWMKDTPAFEHFSERCAEQYKRAQNPVLNAKLERLLEEARQSEGKQPEPAGERQELIVSAYSESTFDTIYSRMRECVDNADRARCALTLLLQSTESASGYLYGVRDSGLALLAALPEVEVEPEMTRWVEQCLEAELAAEVAATGSWTSSEDASEAEAVSAAGRYVDSEGLVFEPILLISPVGHEPKVAAVLALHVMPGPRTVPSRELRSEIANQLIEHGDVDGAGLGLRLPTQRR